MLSSRTSLRASGGAGDTTQQKNAWTTQCNAYPPQCDWAKQDYGTDFYIWYGKPATDTSMERSMIQTAITELGTAGSGFQTELQWESCVSCHLDGRSEALNWDNLNDGIGSPKQTKSMLCSHLTPPVNRCKSQCGDSRKSRYAAGSVQCAC